MMGFVKKPEILNVGGGNAVQRPLTWAQTKCRAQNGERGRTMEDQNIRTRSTGTGPRLQPEILEKEHDISRRRHMRLPTIRRAHPWTSEHPGAGATHIERNRPVFRFGACLAGRSRVSEYIITYQGKPTFTVSIMEFRDGKVMHETQYFADPFEAPVCARTMGRADEIKNTYLSSLSASPD